MAEIKPSIRFAEYFENWDIDAIGNLFSERDERSSEGELISVTINSGVVKAADLNRRDSSSDDKSHYKRVEPGDIAYNTMRMWQGASGYSKYRGILSPAYTVIKPIDSIDAEFFSYMFKKPELIHQFAINSQGLTKDTWNLKFHQMAKILVSYPKYYEQIRIREFLLAIDKRLNETTKQLSKLQSLKKSMLGKMFPQGNSLVPEIRFSGFTENWEPRKVGEVTYELEEYTSLKSGLPLLTSSRSGLMYQNEYRGYVTTDNDQTLFSVVPLGSCTYRHMSDDDVFHLNINALEPGLVSREYPVFNATPNNDIEFIVQYINSSKPFVSFCKEQKLGGTRTRLYYKNLCQFSILMPSLSEQCLISKYFSSLEKLITLRQNELEIGQHLKQAFLKAMFI